MKTAITASGSTLDDEVDPRFGRCAYFLIVESETMKFEAVENANIALGGGAGIQSAQLMAEKDVRFVLTGNCGPNAFRTLGAADIQVIIGVNGTVRGAIEQFKSGALTPASDSNVASHFGMGAGSTGVTSGGTQPSVQQPVMAGGMGMGRGMGGGRGMGMGGGMGRGTRSTGSGQVGIGGGMAGTTEYPPPDDETELETLRAQARAMEEQLRAITAPISQAEQRSAPAGLVTIVDVAKCDACGKCKDVCPTQAITVDEVAQLDTIKCDCCSRCVAECPQGAISVQKAS